LTADAARERLEAIGARHLWIAYHDYAGLARAKAVGPDRLDDALVEGVGWALANWDLAVTDHQVQDPAFAADSGDFRLVPDDATIRPLPHRPGTALAYGWLTEPGGSAWDGDPRRRLEVAQRRLAARGLDLGVGIEAEFYLAGSTASGSYEPDERDRMFSQASIDARWPLLQAVLDGLASMDIPVHQIAKEYGPSQFEISLLPAPPLEAVDRFLAARDVIKSLAREHGLIASFMPKPWEDLSGCGLHVHLGATDAGGSDALSDPADDGALSPTGGSMVAGLLAHAAGQVALGAPTVNSAKRLLPGSWAPAHAMWGVGNRAALVRVPSRGPGRHLEYRAGDMGANLYLHVTGLLAALEDGLEHGLVAPAAVQRDVGHLTDDEAAVIGAPRLDARLDRALDALEADEVLCDALGPLIVAHYLPVKRFEWATYLDESGLGPDAIAVSEWERETYLEVL
jgi:glutamine synthetase